MSEDIFLRRAFIAIGLLVAACALFLIAYEAVNVILLVFLAILFAVFVRTLTDWLSRWGGWGTRLSMLVVCLAILAAAGFAGVLLAPNAIEQIQAVMERLPEVRHRLEQYGWSALIYRVPGMQELLSGKLNIWDRITRSLEFSATFGPLITIGLVMIIGLYAAGNPTSYRDGILKLFPLDRRDRAREVLDTMGGTLRWWLLGQVIGMIYIGVLVGVGLHLMSMPLATTLAILAGLLAFIPNIGYFLSIAPALLLALLQSPVSVFGIVVLYTAAHWTNDYVVMPLVQKRTVLLPPALTITAQLFLGVLLGGLGVLVATPLTAVLLVLVKMVYIHDTLGDEQGSK